MLTYTTGCALCQVFCPNAFCLFSFKCNCLRLLCPWCGHMPARQGICVQMTGTVVRKTVHALWFNILYEVLINCEKTGIVWIWEKNMLKNFWNNQIRFNNNTEGIRPNGEDLKSQLPAYLRPATGNANKMCEISHIWRKLFIKELYMVLFWVNKWYFPHISPC